jgi:hypothetical protein
VVDDLRRHYTANLNSLSSNQKLGWWSDSVNASKKSVTGSSNLVGETTTIGDYSVALNENSQNFSVGINNFKIGDKTTFGFQMTNAAFNPWLSFDGVWGKVNASSTVEGTFTHRSSGYVSKLGIMNTKTDFTPGLVTKVSDMVSMWAEAGYEGSRFSMYAGVLPTVVRGSVKMNLPYAVDYQGTIMYNQVSADIADNAVGYARINYNGEIKKGVTYNIAGVVTHTGYTQTKATIKIDF